MTLVVGNDLNTIVLPDTDTSEKTAVSIWFAGIEVTQKYSRVSSTQVDTDSLGHFGRGSEEKKGKRMRED